MCDCLHIIFRAIIMKRTKRALPYTCEEKQILLEIIKEYPIIESNVASTNKKKMEAWAKVRDTYNENSSSGQRSVVQLKKYWGKTKAKKRIRSTQNQNRKSHNNYLAPPAPHFRLEVIKNFNEVNGHQEQASCESPSQSRSVSPEPPEPPEPKESCSGSTTLSSRSQGQKQMHVDWVKQQQYKNVIAKSKRKKELHKIHLETAEIRRDIAMVELEIVKKQLDQL